MDEKLITDSCGACESQPALTPLITNRPSLSAIAYRVGTFASFREVMLHAISRHSALRGLTTRQSDDPAITLLELWAAVADVLTFYQERIANEAFLRTAKERDSVLRLVRLIDYHLRPGLAATTHLAFTVDDGAKVRIPIGLRVMSTPGQDERPQTFETIEAITADARLNRIPILPQPESGNPFTEDRKQAYLIASEDSLKALSNLRPSDRVVLFNAGQNLDPEEKEIKEIRAEGDRFVLVWTGPVSHTWLDDTQAWVFTRKMRVFGYDAPEAYAIITPNKDDQTKVDWNSAQPVTNLNSVLELPLDKNYKDLFIGDLLLMYETGGTPTVLTVKGISEKEKILDVSPEWPSNCLADHRYRATVTHVTFENSISINNLRNVTIYLLRAPQIPIWKGVFGRELTTGSLYIPAVKVDEKTVEIGRTISGREVKPGVMIRPDEIDIGRAVLLEDGINQSVPAAIAACYVPKDGVDGQDFLVIDVSSLCKIQLRRETAVMLGNVARATHGETVRDEILGDSDALTPFQRFVLRKKPLTYVPSSRSPQGESTLRVLINGMKWTEVNSLYGQQPTGQIYTLLQTDDGTTLLKFGDGITGARLPSGRGNLIATYRQGAGLEGRLKTGQLNILLERPVGLKSATNPAATEGGADPESLADARKVAPTTVKTFGRAISLVDFETLVVASAEVAKAKATWVWRGLEKVVHLTIAGQKGATFSPEVLGRLHSALTHQRDPNHTLLLDNFCRVPIVVTVKILVNDQFVREDVRKVAYQALKDYFAFERVGFAQTVHLSDIYRLLQDVTGVVMVDIDTLHFKGYDKWKPEELAARDATEKPVQSHLRIFSARSRSGLAAEADPVIKAWFGSNPLPDVLPAEQAYIENDRRDITLTATGGLE